MKLYKTSINGRFCSQIVRKIPRDIATDYSYEGSKDIY